MYYAQILKTNVYTDALLYMYDICVHLREFQTSNKIANFARDKLILVNGL